MKDSRNASPRALFIWMAAAFIGLSRAAYLPARTYRKRSCNVYNDSNCALKRREVQASRRPRAFGLFSLNDQNQSSLDGSDDETSLRAQLNQQQKQINLLMQLLQNQNKQTSSVDLQDAPIATTPLALAPSKVMLFIDGTWLYYSLHERREQHCPLIKKYGRGWQQRFTIDWEALPRILCEKLQDPGWRATSGEMHNPRSLEVVRASVFTSYKADTSPLSWRYQMFQDMKAAQYDVHMMETVGKGEKCVDIQL